MNGRIRAMHGGKEENGNRTQYRQDGELKADLSREYQSTDPD
jgi:hypothetical protein